MAFFLWITDSTHISGNSLKEAGAAFSTKRMKYKAGPVLLPKELIA